MILKKSLMVASVLGAVALMAVAGGCSSTPKTMDDGGGSDASTGMDGTVKDTGKQETTPGDSGPMCPTPADVSNFMAETLPAATGKHQNKCSQMLLDTYHKCVIMKDMASCTTITNSAMMDPWKTCLDCLEGSQVTDTTWGPLYCGIDGDPMKCYLNQEGCLNLATGMMGAMSCGQLLHSSFGCQLAACNAQCMGDSQGFTKCVQTAIGGGCKKYADAVPMSCFNADPDGGIADVGNCFKLQNESDSSGLRTRIDTFFCGP